MNLRHVAYAFFLLVLTAALTIWLFEKGFLRMNYPSLSEYPIQGIDVSHHQGAIDWQQVARAPNVKFAYIKATEGGDFRDRRFNENWRAAGAAGLKRGAYHFFTLCRPGRDQAENVLSVVPADAELPLAVDLEFGGNCAARPSLEELISELDDFLSLTRKISAAKPVFYVTPEFFDYYFEGNLEKLPTHHLWIRSIFAKPEQKRCENWALWQFANRGIVEGIGGPVDLNVLCPDNVGLMQIFSSNARPAQETDVQAPSL